MENSYLSLDHLELNPMQQLHGHSITYRKVKVLFYVVIAVVVGTILGFLGGGLSILADKMWQKLRVKNRE